MLFHRKTIELVFHTMFLHACSRSFFIHTVNVLSTLYVAFAADLGPFTEPHSLLPLLSNNDKEPKQPDYWQILIWIFKQVSSWIFITLSDTLFIIPLGSHLIQGNYTATFSLELYFDHKTSQIYIVLSLAVTKCI